MQNVQWALNLAYDRDEGRGFVHRRVAALTMLVFALIGFGLAYGIWGLRKAMREKLHAHSHVAVDDPSRLTAWTLFLLFSADPCVAVMPILFAAAPLGVWPAIAVVLTYELATLAAMLPLVLFSRAGAATLSWHWLEHYGDGAAGGVIAAVGVAVVLLGI